MPDDNKLKRVHLFVGLASLVATTLLGCASAPEAPAPSGMRRVFLSSERAAGGIYESEMLYGGSPTDRFDAKQDRGYLYMVFKDGLSHTYQFTVKSVDTGAITHRSPRVELTGTPRPATWRGYSAWFGIAGYLAPGAYVLELTVDDRAAGVYPFTVF